MREVLKLRILLRRDTVANWELYDPVLMNGETAVSSDLNQVKIGDGVTIVNSLPFSSVLIITGQVESQTSTTFTGTCNLSATDVSTAVSTGKQVYLNVPEFNNIFLPVANCYTNYANFAGYYTGDGKIDSIVCANLQGNVMKAVINSYKTAEEIAEAIANAQLLTKKVVGNVFTQGALPKYNNVDDNITDYVPEENVLYLVRDTEETNVVYKEWMVIDNTWALLGSTKMNLDDYVTEDELSTAFTNYVPSVDYNQLTNTPQTVALSTSISAVSTDNNAVSPKAVYDYVQTAITSLPTVYTGDTTPDSTFGNV